MASVDVETFTVAAHRYAAQGQKNSAKEKLEVLEPQVVEAILKNSRTLIVRNNVAKDLSSLQKMGDVVTLDYLALDKELVAKIFPKAKGAYSFTANTQSQVDNLLQDLFVKKVNVATMPSFRIEATKNGQVNSEAAAVQKMDAWLTEAYGDELKRILLRHEMFDAAKNKIDFDKLNFLIINVPENFTASLVGGTSQYIVLSADGTDTESSLLVTAEMTDEELNQKLKKVFTKKGKKK